MENPQSPDDVGLSLFEEPAQSAQFRMKDLRISVPLSETDTGAGNYYSVDYNVAQGEKPLQTDLGGELEVVVLRNAMKVSFYNDQLKYTEWDSSEFRAWSDGVALYHRDEKETTLYAYMPYSMATGQTIKNLRDGKGLPFKMRYIAYVLVRKPGDTDWTKAEIMRMSIPPTTNVGADAQDKPLFEHPSDDSFEGCKIKCNKETPKTMNEHLLTIKTRKHSKKIILSTFEIKERLSADVVRGPVTEATKFLYTFLFIQAQKKFIRGLKTARDFNEAILTDLTPQELDQVAMDPRQLISLPKNKMSEMLLGTILKGGAQLLAAPREKPKELGQSASQASVSDAAAFFEGGVRPATKAEQEAAGIGAPQSQEELAAKYRKDGDIKVEDLPF